MFGRKPVSVGEDTEKGTDCHRWKAIPGGASPPSHSSRLELVSASVSEEADLEADRNSIQGWDVRIDPRGWRSVHPHERTRTRLGTCRPASIKFTEQIAFVEVAVLNSVKFGPERNTRQCPNDPNCCVNKHLSSSSPSLLLLCKRIVIINDNAIVTAH